MEYLKSRVDRANCLEFSDFVEDIMPDEEVYEADDQGEI